MKDRSVARRAVRNFSISGPRKRVKEDTGTKTVMTPGAQLELGGAPLTGNVSCGLRSCRQSKEN